MALATGRLKLALPATAADKGASPERTRTLLLQTDANDDVTAHLMRGGGTTLDGLSAVYAARTLNGPVNGETLAADDDAAADLRRAVAIITAGTGVDPRGELSRLGIAHVVLQQSDTSAELLAGKMDSVPGLTPVGQTESGWLWRVTGQLNGQDAEAGPQQTGRARVLAADGTVDAVLPSQASHVQASLPAGGEDRLLVLAERSDPGWKASLNGTPLPATADGWAQAWKLPAEGGELEIGYATVWEPWVGIVQVLVIALTVLLAVPTRSRIGAVRLPGRQEPRRTGPAEPRNAAADSTAAGSTVPVTEPAVAADAGRSQAAEPAGTNHKVNAAGESGPAEGMR